MFQLRVRVGLKYNALLIKYLHYGQASVQKLNPRLRMAGGLHDQEANYKFPAAFYGLEMIRVAGTYSERKLVVA